MVKKSAVKSGTAQQKPKKRRKIKGEVADYIKMQAQLTRKMKRFVARNIESIFLLYYAPQFRNHVQIDQRELTLLLPHKVEDAVGRIFWDALYYGLQEYLKSLNYKISEEG